jgi:xanthine dehydrogenase accessory factor
MPVDLLKTAWSLKQSNQPFVMATVIRIEKPTSSKPGAKAIITPDGAMDGWVGGSCAEPIVRREARKAMETGEPRFLRLCPPEARNKAPQEGVIEVELTCISGGTMEIYLEPYLPQPHLIVIGHHQITPALVQQAKSLDYHVTVMSLEPVAGPVNEANLVLQKLDFRHVRTDPNTAIVVCSHGNYDEMALVEALKTDASYIGLVASKKRLAAVQQYLKDSELTEAQIARLKCPAGLDLGAVTPPEIALSIMAEIIEMRRTSPPVWQHSEAATGEGPTEAMDPVCHMTVEVATARYISEYEGQKYYFCNAGCQKSFEKEPEKYLVRG